MVYKKANQNILRLTLANIHAKSLHNTGHADLGDTELKLKEDLTNDKGTLKMGEVAADIGGTLANLSGTVHLIKGMVKAKNLRNERTSKKEKIDEGIRQGEKDVLDGEAVMAIQESLKLDLTEDLHVIGGEIQAGENLYVKARNVILEAKEEKATEDVRFGPNFDHSTVVKQHRAKIGGKKVEIEAEEKLYCKGMECDGQERAVGQGQNHPDGSGL